MEILPTPDIHPTGEILELYSLGRLSGTDLDDLEEHLLLCHQCQDCLEETDDYVAAVRLAVQEMHDELLAAGSLNHHPYHVPGRIWTGAAIAALAIASLTWRGSIQAPEQAVRLEALRGLDHLSGRAPSSSKLVLEMEIRDLPEASEYRLEIVDSRGRSVWTGIGNPVNGVVSARTEKTFPTGMYWARVYSRDSELLREFGLRVE